MLKVPVCRQIESIKKKIVAYCVATSIVSYRDHEITMKSIVVITNL